MLLGVRWLRKIRRDELKGKRASRWCYELGRCQVVLVVIDPNNGLSQAFIHALRKSIPFNIVLSILIHLSGSDPNQSYDELIRSIRWKKQLDKSSRLRGWKKNILQETTQPELQTKTSVKLVRLGAILKKLIQFESCREPGRIQLWFSSIRSC